MFVTVAILLIPALMTSADHSGAYSSPQYAKKLHPKGFNTNNLYVSPPEKDPDGSLIKLNHTRRDSILNSAEDFISSNKGQFMTSLAKSFMGRSAVSQVGFDCVSQVLSLNLTNLVILIVLKALVLAAAFFGSSLGWHGNSYGRSLNDNNITYLTEEEILLYLSYLSGQKNKDYGCLYQLSCQKPEQAAQYSSGADLLLLGTKIVNGHTGLKEYEEVSRGISEAVKWGENGGKCESRYRCGE